MQRKLDANRTHLRGSTPREPLPDGFTLLHGGLVTCARCGFPMARHRRELASGVVGYYMCSARIRQHDHPCGVHSINAPQVDELTLRVVAAALVDPERTVALANGASERMAQAETNLAIVASHLDATRERLRDLDAERVRYEKILRLLDAAKDGDTVVEYRAKLSALDAERARLTERAEAMTPQRARAEAGVAMLAALLEGRMLTQVTHEGRVYDVASFTPAGLLAMTGGSPAQIAALAHDLGAEVRAEGDAIDAALFDEWFHREPMGQAELAYLLLSLFTPPGEHRRLLRALDVRVSIRPPRTASERAEHGFTPYWERVRVALGGLILWDGASVRASLGADGTESDANVSTFASGWVQPTWAPHVA